MRISVAVLVICISAVHPGSDISDLSGSAEAVVQSVPPEIMKKAEQFVISKVGVEFFQEHMSLHGSDLERARPASGTSYDEGTTEELDGVVVGYRFSYDIQVADRPIPAGHVWFKTDLDGNADPETVHGLPDCVSCPEECEFPMDEGAAREVAILAGLDPGLREWRVSLLWHGGFRTYVWNVMNVTNESPDLEEGKSVLIDANDGGVLSVCEYYANITRVMRIREDRALDSADSLDRR
jgi:hypothetical protein